jgi:hypothetical protein
MDLAMVPRLRLRGCWSEAAALLAGPAETDFAAALARAEVLVEAAMFTLDGWAEAHAAVDQADRLAHDPRTRGLVATERGNLAYAETMRSTPGAADTARECYAAADRLLPPGDPARAALDFRRGVLAETVDEDRPAARAWYERAHAAASTDLLRSYTWRHLASVAADEGDLAYARHGFAESLRLRERCGFLVGLAAALDALASVSEEPAAGALRAEAARLVRAFGGVPAWLAQPA